MGIIMYLVPKKSQSFCKIIFALTYFLVRPIFLTYIIMMVYKCTLNELTYFICISFLAMYIPSIYIGLWEYVESTVIIRKSVKFSTIECDNMSYHALNHTLNHFLLLI